MTKLCCLIVLIPAVAFAEKPTCETIRKLVEDGRKKAVASLEEELETLEKLKNDIRRGRGKLEGDDGRKSRREQLQIVLAKIKANEAKVIEAKDSVPIPDFTIQDLKIGNFGYFGNEDDDFRIVEVIDDKSFTAFIRYRTYTFVTRSLGGSTVSYPVQDTKTTSSLYLVKGIETKGYTDGKSANWKGYLYCSGTKKLQLTSGAETVFVLEPLDVEACLNPPKP